MKKPLAATLIAATTLGSVAAGATLFGPGLAGAQDSAPSAPATAPGPDVQRRDPAAHITEALQPLVDNGTLTESQVAAVVDALQAARPDRGHDGRRGPGGPDLEALAEVLGTDAQSIGEQLRSGQTLGEIATANGVDLQTVVDTIVSGMQARIQEGVDSGRIDQAKADEMLANAAELAQGIVDGTAKPGRGGPGGHENGRPGGPDLESLAGVLGTDADTLGQELRSGQSLSDIAEANGVDTQSVVDAIVDNIEARIQEGVDSGRIDQAKADEMLANAQDHAGDIVEGNVKPGGPRGNRGPGNGGPGFGGPRGSGGPGSGGPSA